MSGKQSKTARISVRAGADAAPALQSLGDVKYLIPLNHGKNASVRDMVSRRMLNLRTDSAAFVEEIRIIAEAGHGSKIKAALEALATAYPGDGWDVTLKRLIVEGPRA